MTSPTLGRSALTAWAPSWDLIATRHLELRRRRGLLIVTALLTAGVPVLILGIRMLFHAFDPASYGPAGSPSLFQDLSNLIAQFGFLVAAAVGAAAGTSDLSEGVFRNLVITGRSRLALYLARIPAGLAILLPIVALAFTIVCLVTSYAGVPDTASVSVGGVAIPLHLDQAGLRSWIQAHPHQAAIAFGSPTGPNGRPVPTTGQASHLTGTRLATFYSGYTSQEIAGANPAVNEMIKIGLWIELDIGIAFLAGLGLGSLTGQRTLSTIVLIALQIIVTPLLARVAIPYFLDGQRLVVGIAMDQLRPAGLAAGQGGGPGGPGGLLFGGHGALGIPPMPTWAMISVIAGWVVGWSAIGAGRMMTRDA